MARKIPTTDGVPVGWWNRLVVDTDLQYVLIVVVGFIVAAVLYAVLK